MAEAFNFKQKVNEELIAHVTGKKLKDALRDGTIDPKSKLFLDMGISEERMRVLARPFNDLIDDFGKSPKRYVSSDDLADCGTLQDLYDLLEPSFS